MTIVNTTRLLAAACLLAGAWTSQSARADEAPATTQMAKPHHTRHHARHAQRTAMVTPPLTPGVMPHPAAPPAEGPAPTPNDGVTAPIEPQKEDVDVHPSVFQLHYPHIGDGYVTGSSPQAMDDRNAAKATGMEMQVPLNQ